MQARKQYPMNSAIETPTTGLFDSPCRLKTHSALRRKLSAPSISANTWAELPLDCETTFDPSALYQVQLALSDERCVASQVLRVPDPESGYCGLLFELPSEYLPSKPKTGGDKKRFGFVYHSNKAQWYGVEFDSLSGKMHITSAPPENDSDDMNLGWKVLFQVDSIHEYRCV